jgi:nicotinamide riboside kinase
MLKRVAILGPESTGKSELCIALAKHFNGLVIEEQARNYLSKQNNSYSQADLHAIAQLQFDANNTSTALPYLFADTEMYVMKIWSEFKYNSCSLPILNLLARQQFDLYLLTAIDLPWQHDAQREYPDAQVREGLFEIYKAHLIAEHTPFCIIGGLGADRTNTAIAAVEQYLS